MPNDLRAAVEHAHRLWSKDEDLAAAASVLLDARAKVHLEHDGWVLADYARLARDIACDLEGSPADLFESSLAALRRRTELAGDKVAEAEALADLVSTLVEWSVDFERRTPELELRALRETATQAEAALDRVRRANAPLTWGHLHRCLADVLVNIAEATHDSALFSKAISSYREELDVLQTEALPSDWNRDSIMGNAQVRLADGLLAWATADPERREVLDEAVALFSGCKAAAGSFAAEYAAERAREARTLQVRG